MNAVVELRKEELPGGMDLPRTDFKASKQRRKQLWIGGSAIALIALVTMSMTLDPAAPSVDADGLWTETVQRGDMLRQVRGPGVLVPKEIRWVAAAAAGRVERVMVKPGAVVEADTVLVEMTNPELVRLAEEARWQLDAAIADLHALEARLISDRLSLEANLAQVRADAESARLQAQAEEQLVAEHIIPEINYRRTVLNAEQLAVRLDIEEQRLTGFDDSMTAQSAAQTARVEQFRHTLERQQELIRHNRRNKQQSQQQPDRPRLLLQFGCRADHRVSHQIPSRCLDKMGRRLPSSSIQYKE